MKNFIAVNRRKLITGGAALAGTTYSQTATAQEVFLGLEAPRKFPVGEDVKSIEEYYDDYIAFTGEEDAYKEEIVEAEAILDRAPKGRTPYEVALYFYDLRAGALGNKIARYGHEWPRRFNPVIVKFFEKTQIKKPAGDTTAWCSAFVNWCVDRSRIERSDREALNANQKSKITSHAGALSWRNFGSSTDAPQIGDIVVLARTDKVGKKGGKGHVGFFLHRMGDRISILGGNQSAPINEKNGGEVNASIYNVGANSIFELASFRTHESIR